MSTTETSEPTLETLIAFLEMAVQNHATRIWLNPWNYATLHKSRNPLFDIYTQRSQLMQGLMGKFRDTEIGTHKNVPKGFFVSTTGRSVDEDLADFANGQVHPVKL